MVWEEVGIKTLHTIVNPTEINEMMMQISFTTKNNLELLYYLDAQTKIQPEIGPYK